MRLGSFPVLWLRMKEVEKAALGHNKNRKVGDSDKVPYGLRHTARNHFNLKLSPNFHFTMLSQVDQKQSGDYLLTVLTELITIKVLVYSVI